MRFADKTILPTRGSQISGRLRANNGQAVAQKKSQNQKSEKVAKSKIGNIRRIELDGKSFIYCTRYFDLSSCHDENAPVEF